MEYNPLRLSYYQKVRRKTFFGNVSTQVFTSSFRVWRQRSVGLNSQQQQQQQQQQPPYCHYQTSRGHGPGPGPSGCSGAQASQGEDHGPWSQTQLHGGTHMIKESSQPPCPPYTQVASTVDSASSNKHHWLKVTSYYSAGWLKYFKCVLMCYLEKEFFSSIGRCEGEWEITNK
jgi:hypothetical protein